MSTPITGAKAMQTWRLPVELVSFLRAEARRYRHELTPFAIRLLNAYRNFYELPVAAVALLERDRAALKMGRLEYFGHVLYRRTELLRERGPGFDGPSTEDKQPE